jgi:hypothetical protein
MSTVLIVGVPRSGTTWVAEVLAAGGGASYLEEPDNHFRFGFAFRAKRLLGRRDYPSLERAEAGPAVRDYTRLWAAASAPTPATPARLADLRRRSANRLIRAAGSRRVAQALAGETRHSAVLGAAAALARPERAVGGAESLIVKSVYAPLTVEWIAAHWPVEVVVVQRSPLNVLSSWIKLGWLAADAPEPLATLDPGVAADLAARFDVPPPRERPLARATWLIAILSCALDDAARRAVTWQRVLHEDLCADPETGFAEVAARAGLGWSDAGRSLLQTMNRPGERYETSRVAAELHDAWRRRLDDDQVEEISAVLDSFPLVGARLT